MQPTLNGEEIVMLMVMPAFLVVTAWAFRVLLDFMRQRRTSRYQYEVQTKLLDKFGTAPELLDYLKSESGARFLESSMTEPRPHPQSRILGSMQTGVVLSALGVGFLVLRPLMPAAAEPFAVFGVLALCLGIGFLVSCWIASSVARKWGLLGTRDDDSDVLTT